VDDVDFFSHLQQIWSKTTGAEHMYWMPEQDQETPGKRDYSIYAVNEDGDKNLVASDLLEEDVDFVTGVHGCLPDLVRRLLAAVDESDRLDEEKDNLVVRVAELENEADEFTAIIGDLQTVIEQLESGRV